MTTSQPSGPSDWAAQRHNLHAGFKQITTIFPLAESGRYCVIRSTKLTSGTLRIHRVVEGAPRSGGAMTTLCRLQRAVDQLAASTDTEDRLVAEAGQVWLNHQLNLLGHKFVSCPADQGHAALISARLEQDFEKLKNFKGHPEKLVCAFYSFLSAVGCGKTRATG